MYLCGISRYAATVAISGIRKARISAEIHADLFAYRFAGRGVEFASQYADFNFALGAGVNTPTAFAQASSRLVEGAEKTGRDVGSYVLFMLITGSSDEEAEAKWTSYKDGADTEALSWMFGQTAQDKQADANASATRMALPEGAVNMNIGTLVGSYAKVAGMLDEIAGVKGTKGIMLIFDNFTTGVEVFGKEIQPLMRSRKGKGVVNGA